MSQARSRCVVSAGSWNKEGTAYDFEDVWDDLFGRDVAVVFEEVARIAGGRRFGLLIWDLVTLCNNEKLESECKEGNSRFPLGSQVRKDPGLECCVSSKINIASSTRCSRRPASFHTVT